MACVAAVLDSRFFMGSMSTAAQTDAEDDLDEYAKWAAEAAAKATSGEFPAAKSAAPKPHKPIPMPMPSALKPKKQD